MTDDTDHPDEGSLADQAADWFVRTRSDAAEEADWLALAAWLERSPEHRQAFEQVERLWAELDDLAPAPQTVRAASRPAAPADGWRRRDWIAAGSAIAASLVVILGGLFWMNADHARTLVLATAKGETRSVTLQDGSRVDLNGDTLLEVRLGQKLRRATLTRGEVAFDVAKDPNRPFVVDTGDRRVTVLGTQFNVLRHAGRIVVTVKRGVVHVAPRRKGGGEPVRLTPGRQLVHHEGSELAEVSTVDPGEAFSWREGYLVFRDRPLPEVAEDLNRYFATPIRVEGAARRLNFSGALMLDDEDAVIRRLEAFLPVRAHRSPGQIALRSRS